MRDVLRIADSARIPSNDDIARAAHSQGIDGWAGYLSSPYASVSWPRADLFRVLGHADRLLPIFVGPYNAATLARMNPARDAEQAHKDLTGIAADVRAKLVILDIEPGAWAASPADVLHYFATFRAHLHAAGIEVAPYASPGTLIGLGQHNDIAHVWCASWRASSGRKPSPLWPTGAIDPPGLGNAWAGHRGWQQAGNVKCFGKGLRRPRVDLSVFPDTFPMMTAEPHPTPHPTPTPTPTPAPVARVSVTVKTADGHTYRGSIPRTG